MVTQPGSFQNMKIVYLSVVIPVYSGENYIEELVVQLENLKMGWEKLNLPIQIGEAIFVNDGAIDRSEEVIARCSLNRPWIVNLPLSKNFGQHPATMAGILHSSGDWIVTIDEDLQHPPQQIPSLLALAVAGSHDVVYVNSTNGVHRSVKRDIGSKFVKSMFSKLTGNRAFGQISSFRLIRGTVARAASSVCSFDAYFDVVLSWFTDRTTSISIPLEDCRYIESGKSGYNYRSLVSHARRLAITSHLKILRLGALLGFSVVALSLVGGVALFVAKLLFPNSIEAVGWTSIMLSQAFFNGLTLFLLGIVLEFLSVLVLKAHGRPLFFVIDRSKDELLVEVLEDLQR
jgi:polyisoprenyl-phosphate glycosyltransferase